ncbi:MAG TPA: glycoside hydrolase family 25 protein [Actinomycetota bacterium]|nr:glycoside hydrolase family 25 protein [Actinomycetota bacterium]
MRLLASLVITALVGALLPLVNATPAYAQDYTLGIDVSHHQGNIDWQKVADSGHVYAFHKATEGVTFTDNTYAGNRTEAAAASIPFGAYHFARPNGNTVPAAESDAAGEAQHFLNVAQPEPGDLLPVLDLEATGNLPPDRLIAWTRTWVNAVADAVGAQPLIYTSPSFWETNLSDTTSFAEAGFPLWLAHYTSAPAPRTPADDWDGRGWAFWQWTSCASVPGISGCADEDRFEGTDLSPYTIPGAPEPEPTPDDSTPPVNDSRPEISGRTEVGQKLTASKGTWSGSKPMSFSFAWYRCTNDSDCSAVLGGTKPTYKLDPSDYQHRMKVTVTATNGAGSSSADSSTTESVTDSTAPLPPQLTKPRKQQTLSTSLNVVWDPSEKEARYAIRYRSSSKDGSFGGYREIVSDTDQTSAKLRADTGAAYCFSARATDQAGNVSEWSGERCTDVPLDDRDLSASTDWRRGTSRSFFLRTFLRTRAKGASLSAGGVSVREIHVVAQTCPSCGKLAVLLDGRRVGTVGLRSKRARSGQVIRVKRFTSLRNGVVELEVISGRAPVKIDGLVLSVR